MTDFYLLDSSYMPEYLVEDAESIIWTPRFYELGDFELVVPATTANRTRYYKNRRLWTPGGKDHVMLVETIEDQWSSDGRKLKITGRSIERVFQERILKNGALGWTGNQNYIDSGKPVELVERMVDRALHNVAFRMSSLDAIPELVWGDVGDKSGTIQVPLTDVRLNLKPGTLYAAISSLCKQHQIGFRLYRRIPAYNEYVPELRFEVYTGRDRTSAQTVNPPAVFSSELENLSATTEFTSITDAMTIAYVFSKNGMTSVTPSGVVSGSGMNRRVLYVDATDIETAAGTNLQSELRERGLAALAENSSTYIFDGEVDQSQTPGSLNFELGDLVEMVSPTGVKTPMRVVEMIYISDGEGERVYPTLLNPNNPDV